MDQAPAWKRTWLVFISFNLGSGLCSRYEFQSNLFLLQVLIKNNSYTPDLK